MIFPALTLASLEDTMPFTQPNLLWLIVAGLIGASMFFSNVLGALHAWTSLRTRKDEMVTRTELSAVHKRVDELTPYFYREMGRSFGELKQLIEDKDKLANEHRSEVTEQLAGIQRSMGQIEGLEPLIESHTAQISQLQGRAFKAH